MEMLRALVMVGILAAVRCQVKELMVENTSYVEVMDGYQLTASKQMEIADDKNMLTFQLKMLTLIEQDGAENNTGLGNLTMSGPTNNTVGVASQYITAAIRTFLGDMKVKYELFTADGVVGRDDENTTVMTGDVAISCNLTGLNLSENVTDLKLTFSASGSADPTADDATTAVDYNLGGKGKITLSEKAMVGSDYIDVSPMMSNMMFSLTVNAANLEDLEYSVFLKLADIADDTDGDGDSSSSSRISSLGSAMTLLMLVHRFFW